MSPSPRDTQSRLLQRRRVLRWLRVAPLIIAAALTACAGSNSTRKVGRSQTYITGNDHRDGGGEAVNVFGVSYGF